MSVRDARRWITRTVPTLGGCVGVLLAPILLAVGFAAWAATSLDGCEVDVDLGPSAVGLTSRPGGAITAILPSCANQQFTFVRLLAEDGTTLWSAESSQTAGVGRLTVGTAPRGFRDSVPLAGPLDPRASYDLQLLVVRPAGPTTTVTAPAGETMTTAMEPALVFGARAQFRLADLRPDRVWVDGRLVTADRLDRTACPSDDEQS